MVRITPACAGKTWEIQVYFLFLRDHPRVCGENQFYLHIGTFPEGSPPRVRGKLPNCRETMRINRITPACAGKTREGLRQRLHHEDHPRVCGENARYDKAEFDLKGSPPRVRGKRTGAARWTKRPRITPACAGKTLESSSTRAACGDHPRVCGENE